MPADHILVLPRNMTIKPWCRPEQCGRPGTEFFLSSTLPSSWAESWGRRQEGTPSPSRAAPRPVTDDGDRKEEGGLPGSYSTSWRPTGGRLPPGCLSPLSRGQPWPCPWLIVTIAHLVLVHHLHLLQDLHCVHVTSVKLLHQSNLSKCTLNNSLKLQSSSTVFINYYC